MTTEEVRALLLECRDLLARTRQRIMGEPDLVDGRLAMTVGFADGVICEGLEAERQDRPVWFERNLTPGGAEAPARTSEAVQEQP